MLINSLFTLISPPAINNELECIVQLLQGPLTQTLKMGDWCYHKSVFDLKTVEKHVYPSNPKYGFKKNPKHRFYMVCGFLRKMCCL